MSNLSDIIYDSAEGLCKLTPADVNLLKKK